MQSEVLQNCAAALMRQWVLQELADSGQAVGLNIPQLASLRDCLAALHWATRARALLASTQLDPRPGPPQPAPAEHPPAQRQAGADSSRPSTSAPARDSTPAPLQPCSVRAAPHRARPDRRMQMENGI